MSDVIDNTKMSVPSPKCVTLISRLLKASIPYASGSSEEIILRAFGKPWSGKIAPDKKNNGITRKFMMSWKPCISSRSDAIIVPSAVNKIATKNITKSTNGNIIQLVGLKPKNYEIKKSDLENVFFHHCQQKNVIELTT